MIDKHQSNMINAIQLSDSEIHTPHTHDKLHRQIFDHVRSMAYLDHKVLLEYNLQPAYDYVSHHVALKIDDTGTDTCSRNGM